MGTDSVLTWLDRASFFSRGECEEIGRLVLSLRDWAIGLRWKYVYSVRHPSVTLNYIAPRTRCRRAGHNEDRFAHWHS